MFSSLMAPMYKFQGPYTEYELPVDDIEGIINIYGPPKRGKWVFLIDGVCKTT